MSFFELFTTSILAISKGGKPYVTGGCQVKSVLRARTIYARSRIVAGRGRIASQRSGTSPIAASLEIHLSGFPECQTMASIPMAGDASATEAGLR